MESLARRARQVIATDLELATSVERLSDRLARAGDGLGREPVTLIRELRRHPRLFRVVDPWRGPWRTVPAMRRSGDGSADPTRGHPSLHVSRGLRVGAMVVPIDVEWHEGGRGLTRRLRECVYRLGRSVDVESPVAVARWARLIRGAAATQRRLGRDPSARAGDATEREF